MVPLSKLIGRANMTVDLWAEPNGALAPLPPHLLEGPTPNPRQTVRTHDRSFQAALGTRGILLENQDVGGDVQRRMRSEEHTSELQSL